MLRVEFTKEERKALHFERFHHSHHGAAIDGGENLKATKTTGLGVSEKRRVQLPRRKTGAFVTGGLLSSERLQIIIHRFILNAPTSDYTRLSICE